MSSPYQAPESSLENTWESPIDNGNLQKGIRGDFDLKIGEIFSTASQRLKGSKTHLLLCFMLYGAISSVGSFVGMFAMIPAGIFENEIVIALSTLLYIVISMVASVVGMTVFGGAVILGLRHLNGLRIDVGFAMRYLNRSWTLFLWYLVSTLLIMVGYLFLILPGIYLTVAYALAFPLLFDKKLKVWEALESSRKAVSHQWFKIAILLFLLGVINFIAMLPLGIGLLWSLPWSVLVYAETYRRIFGVEPESLA